MNCPKGLDADFAKRVCRNCGRSIHFQRVSHRRNASGQVVRQPAHWQHNVDMAGIAWKREFDQDHR
jgi:hypothetical protein